MNKKICSIIVCMLMAISLINTNINSVKAEDNTNQTADQDDQNNTGIKCGENAYGYYDETGDILTIKGSGQIDQTFRRDRDFSKVIIEEGITGISEYAFDECSTLRVVQIPSTVTEIGKYAFSYTSISYINLPDNLLSIEEATFAECSSLRSVTMPNNVESIGKAAFLDCAKLKDVTIPNSVQSIGDGAFNGCEKLTNIVIPKTVTSIGTSAFNKSVNLIVEEGSAAYKYAKDNNYNYVRISLDSSTKDMSVGETSILLVDGENQDGPLSNNDVTWSSSNDKVVTVDNQGVVTALAEGTATITATTDLGAKATCIVTVKKNQSIIIDRASIADSTITCSNGEYTGKEVQAKVSVNYNGTVLSEGVDYVVSYSHNVNAGTATATVTGIGRYAGSKQVTFNIARRSIQSSEVECSDATYTGQQVQSTVTVKDGDRVLKEGTDYTLTYKNNVQVGTAQVTVTGIGNYKDTITKAFTIQPKVVVNPSDKNDGSPSNKNDVEIDVDKRVDGYGDLSDKTQEAIQESTKEFLEKNYSNELKALPSGAKIETEVSIKPLDESQLTQAQKDKLKNALRKGVYILAYYDVSVSATAYTKDGNVIYGMDSIEVTQLDNSIQISITIPDKYLKANRKFGILRLHDGQVAELSSTVKDNVITFNTDCFSIYALTGEDVNGTVNTSDTLSSTLPFIAMGVSAMLIVGLYVTRKKKSE